MSSAVVLFNNGNIRFICSYQLQLAQTPVVWKTHNVLNINHKEYSKERIKQTTSCPVIYNPNFKLIGCNTNITEDATHLFIKGIYEFSKLSQSIKR